MIQWLTDTIATGAFNKVANIPLEDNIYILDVRDLVDKSGNDLDYVNGKINESLAHLKEGEKIVICCDYGMSRSNSIAIGVIVKWLSLSFEEAVSIVLNVVNEGGIKTEMLNTVYEALYIDRNTKENNPKIENRILLTGAGGFIGKRLKNTLLGFDNFEIHSPSSKELNLLEDNISLYQMIKSGNINVIIHLANPQIFTTNKSVGDTLVMLKNILDVCRINKVKLIYLSGWEIYSGYKSEGLLVNENTEPNPKGTYGETKWLSELLIKQYAANYGIEYQIIRSGPLYGTDGEKPKFIYNFINKAIKNEDIVTHRYRNGYPKLDILFIDDMIDAIIKAINNGFIGEINIGSGHGLSTYDIATIICELTESKSVIRHVEIQEYAPNIIMDTSFAQELLSWKPVNNIRSGLNKIIDKIKQS